MKATLLFSCRSKQHVDNRAISTSWPLVKLPNVLAGETGATGHLGVWAGRPVHKVARSGGELQQAPIEALLLAVEAKVGNRAAAARAAEVRRVALGRAPHVQAEAVGRTTLDRAEEAAARVQMAKSHRAAGRGHELQHRRRVKYVRSQRDQRLQAEARHGIVRRSPAYLSG
jgi:hypothetical protein